MEIKEFKKTFIDIAKQNGFTYLFNAMFKESDDCIIALILRKSHYSRLYYLRFKVHIKTEQSVSFDKKKWTTHDVSEVLIGFDSKYNDLFNLENSITPEMRKTGIEELFLNNLNEITAKSLTKAGLVELYQANAILIIPPTKLKLGVN